MQEVCYTDRPVKGVDVDIDHCVEVVNDTGIPDVAGYGTDLGAYGQTVDVCKLMREVFPGYTGWKDRAEGTVHTNSWSMVSLLHSIASPFA